MKPKHKISLIAAGLIVLLFVGGLTFYLWPSDRKYATIQQGIIQHESQAITQFNQADQETQRAILQDPGVKKALVTFYPQPLDLSEQLAHYSVDIQTLILKDDIVYHSVRDQFFTAINQAVKTDNFSLAFQLLNDLQTYYPQSQELSVQQDMIYQAKQERLAALTQKYMECLDQTLLPLLERTHCMVEARKKIEYVGIEHSLPNDPNLLAMYAEEIQHALSEKNYERAESLLVDWQQLSPESSETRDELWQGLQLHRQLGFIINDLNSQDQEKITKRLGQLYQYPTLKGAALEFPQVKALLVNFYIREIAELVKNETISLNNYQIERLKHLIADNNNKTTPITTQRESEIPNPQNQTVTDLLTLCQKHFEEKRLTTGRMGTALECYQQVLKRDPNNQTATNGLKAIENRYFAWANLALQQNQFDKVKIYIAGIQKVNPHSVAVAQLSQQLKEQLASSPKPPVKNTAPVVVKTPPKPNPPSCENCNCSELLKQVSLGVKALTTEQKQFFQTHCR